MGDLRDRIAAAISGSLCAQQHEIDPGREWQWFDTTHVADEVMAVIEPAIATQATDTRLLAIGSCIALIEHTTALAQQVESAYNAAVIAEWSNKIVTAMRMASAHITS